MPFSWVVPDYLAFAKVIFSWFSSITLKPRDMFIAVFIASLEADDINATILAHHKVPKIDQQPFLKRLAAIRSIGLEMQFSNWERHLSDYMEDHQSKSRQYVTCLTTMHSLEMTFWSLDTKALLNNDNMLSMLVAMFEEKEKKSVRNDRHHVNLHE